MATQLWLSARGVDVSGTPDKAWSGEQLVGISSTFTPTLYPCLLSAGAGGGSSGGASTVAGPTAGLTTTWVWVSPPLSSAVTISGTITFNLWMTENNMSANVGAQCVVRRMDSTGTVASTVVVNSEKGTELPLTSAVQNWTATPTSTAFAKGDRIAIEVLGNDGGGTMATGFQFNLASGGSAANLAESYVQFNETFGFMTSDPTTQTVYPTNTASDIDPGGSGTDTKEMWTARGAGVVTAVTNTATGFTAPLQATVTAGGNLVEWYTKQLQAFTLVGPVLANLRGALSGGANALLRGELAVTASDGSGAVVWAASSPWREANLTTLSIGSEAAERFYLAGADTAISDGQRLRFRAYLDDDYSAMTTGQTCTCYYAGTSGGASGDSYLIFGQTLTERVAAVAKPFQFNPIPFIPKGRSM